jgi:hypothetical protein
MHAFLFEKNYNLTTSTGFKIAMLTLKIGRRLSKLFYPLLLLKISNIGYF